MSISRINPEYAPVDSVGNLAAVRAGRFSMAISNGSDGAFKDVTFDSLPSGKTYGAILTTVAWISPHNVKPVYAVRSLSKDGMNVGATIPSTWSGAGSLTFDVAYIVFAY